METCVASNTPSSSLHTRTCSDPKSAYNKASVANRIFSNVEFHFIARAVQGAIRNLSSLRIWKAGFGRSQGSQGNFIHTQSPIVAHNHNSNINKDDNGYHRRGTSQISAAMMAFLTTLPVASSRRIYAMSDTALQTFSNQTDFFFGSLLSTPPAQSTGCPNPAAILSSRKGTRASTNLEKTDLGANIRRITSKVASLSQSLMGNHLPFKTVYQTHHDTEKSSKRKRRKPSPVNQNSTNARTANPPFQGHAHTTTTALKNVFDIQTTKSPSEEPQAGSTLYKYQQQSDFAHVPVTSGRKELRGSCLGLIIGLVACIMWF